jgi:hypothetical protein
MSDGASKSGEMKVCTRCGLPAEPVENFAIHNRARGTRQSICRSCQNEYVRAHYRANRAAYITKARVRITELIRINGEFLIEYLRNHPCVDCDESDIIVLEFDVLEFDHLRDKVADVSVLARGGYSIETIQKKIDKCEVVCANCHGRRTAKRAGTYRYLVI